MSASESDAVSEEIEESEVEELTSDSDDASTDVEEPNDESSENDDYDDDGDDDDEDDEDSDVVDVTNEQVNIASTSGRKRKKPNKKALVLANEINNHAVYEGVLLMTYQILMNEEEQKVFFRNWTTEKMADTRDIDFGMAKRTFHKGSVLFWTGQREFCYLNLIHFIGIIRIFIPVHVHKSGHTKKVY